MSGSNICSVVKSFWTPELWWSCVKTSVNGSAQAFGQEGEMPSGPGALLVFSLLNSRQTSSFQPLGAGKGSQWGLDVGRKGMVAGGGKQSGHGWV